MKDKIILEEIARNADINIASDSDTIIILGQEHRRIGRQSYEVKYNVQLLKKKEENIIAPVQETILTGQQVNSTKNRIYREIAMEESDPLPIEDITMSDTEFMDIITGKVGTNKTSVYKRKSYSAFMRKFLESFYVTDDRKKYSKSDTNQ